MTRHCLTLLLSTLLCTSGRAQRMLPFSAVPDMVEEVYENILEHHPIGYEEVGRERLRGARTRVQEVLQKARFADSIRLRDFTRLVAPLQEATQCGHLILEPRFDSLTNILVRENDFPLRMARMADGRYLLARGLRTTTDSLPAATEVLAVNGEDITSLVEGMAVFAGLNDRNNVAATFAGVARVFSLYYQRHYGPQETLEISVRGQDGQPATHVIEPVRKRWVDPKKEKTPRAQTINFRWAEDGRTGILDVNSFATRSFEDGNYFQYVKRVFETLKTRGTEALIIDLRDNTGGSSQRINHLFAYLSTGKFRFADKILLTGPAEAIPGESARDRRRRAAGAVKKRERRIQRVLSKPMKPRKAKQRFDGRVVVLINEMTFSASGMFARFVQGAGRGQLVGVRSGASAGVTYGGSSKKLRTFIGPNEEFELKINNITLQLPYAIEDNVTPDVLVPVTEAALRAGRDEQLERALDVIWE